jgi:hypothetical protein
MASTAEQEMLVATNGTPTNDVGKNGNNNSSSNKEQVRLKPKFSLFNGCAIIIGSLYLDEG